MSMNVPGTGEIREILTRRIDQQKQAAGMVVGVVEPSGRRVAAYGNLAMGDPRAVDGDTIFEIGSISKVFTSLLLADMVNRKEAALDDAAAKYLPEHVRMPERSGRPITLLDLATHRSGLPPLPGNLTLGSAEYGVEDLYRFLSGYTLPRDPGSEFEYSNLGAGLLGNVLARRAGMDFESLIKARITEPLGMADTGITLSPAMQRRMATGHTRTLAPVGGSGPPSPLAGAGALRSTSNDMLTFLEGFLGYKESALAPAMKTMLDVRRPAGQTEMGLGWFLYSIDGREIATHSGATAGFASFAGFDRNERIGVVILSNASTPTGVDDIGIHLLDPKAPVSNPAPTKEHRKIEIDPKLFDNYTGRYQVTAKLVFEISRDRDRLFAQGFAQLPQSRPGDLTGLPKFELFAEGEKKFFASVSDSEIEFETGADGRAKSLVLRRGGRDMPAAPRLS